MANERLCTIAGCGKALKYRGYCSAHAERFRLHGDPLGSGPSAKRKSRLIVSVTLTCETCGKAFHPWEGRTNTSKFCSRKCSYPNMKAATLNRPEDFFGKIEKTPSGCWEWSGFRNGSGYGMFGIGGKTIRAHRYSYEMHKGPIPTGLLVCHSCDNPPCVNPDHLWLGTHRDNGQDMSKKGRGTKTPSVHSEQHPLSKLTKDKARAIRADARPARIVAAEYGVSSSLVEGIRRGTHWKYA